jgi:ABC-type dipeptide/oligopeptide/nickel transport system ATPase subunit
MKILEYLRNFKEEYQVTIFFATNDNVTEKSADRIFTIENGWIKNNKPQQQ